MSRAPSVTVDNRAGISVMVRIVPDVEHVAVPHCAHKGSPARDQRPSRGWSAFAAVGVVAQLASRSIARWDGDPGSAVYTMTFCPRSPGRSRDSKSTVTSPTIGWWNRLVPVRWSLTLCAAHRTRNSSLRVASSPMRSVSRRSWGSRPASARRDADGVVGDRVPVDEELRRSPVEEDEPRRVHRPLRAAYSGA